MITSLCRTIQQVSAVAFGGLVLFGALGGALVPLEVLPGLGSGCGPVTPTYWVMRGFGSVILNGRGVSFDPRAVRGARRHEPGLRRRLTPPVPLR